MSLMKSVCRGTYAVKVSVNAMSQNVASIKPLFLTEEEALAILDMCLMSRVENDPARERAMLKLTHLVRCYIQEGDSPIGAHAPASAPEPDPTTFLAAPRSPALSEAALVSERALEVKMGQHTGRVYFGRRLRRRNAKPFLD